MQASKHVKKIILASKHVLWQTPGMAKESYATQFARKGGKARAANLTKEERKAIARGAAAARWSKVKKEPAPKP
jgi:hypothetical protein